MADTDEVTQEQRGIPILDPREVLLEDMIPWLRQIIWFVKRLGKASWHWKNQVASVHLN